MSTTPVLEARAGASPDARDPSSRECGAGRRPTPRRARAAALGRIAGQGRSLRAPIHAVVREPGLGRRDQPSGHLHPAVARPADRPRGASASLPGQREHARPRVLRRREIEKGRQRVRRRATSPGPTSCGMGNRWTRSGSPRRPREVGPRHRAVGRAEIDADDEARTRSFSATARECSSSSFQRPSPSRSASHSSSVPTSVTRLSRPTGTIDAVVARALERHLHGASSSISSSHSSTRSPTAILFAHRGAEKAELRRLADDQAELARRESRPRCLPPCRTARRTAPCTGASQAGHRRHRALDADVVGARRAAADADAAPAPRQP